MMETKKNEVVTTLERAQTRDEELMKSVPIVGKVDYSGAYEKTDPREIALVRKLDKWIMPMLWSMYWLNYLDRNAIALARLDDLEEDLNLTSTQYQTCTSTGLLLTRFFLGVTEAPYYPGAVYMLSMFYTRKEVATRIAILYTGNILATAFAGLIAAGIFHGLGDVGGISGWRWLFILQGAVTFVIAIVGFFLLPDFPHNTWWLTQAERELATNRMALDTVGNKGETSVWAGFRQAGKDPMVWIFAAMAHMHLAANGFKNFFPTVVETLGFGQTITLVLTCPPYLIAGAVTIAVSWSSGKFNERTWHITISKAVATFGFGLACAEIGVAGRYVAMVIFTIGTYGVNSLILGWCGSTCGQTPEKKAVAIGIVTTVMNASFIWTPYLWPKSDGPRYVIALSSSAAFSVATALFAWAAKICFMRKNKKLREEDSDNHTFLCLLDHFLSGYRMGWSCVVMQE
ncbi:MFS transporter [Pyrenophora tritici-repentis]|nr:MFS transporter [Pyrenophora tritici-repentis]